MAENAVPRETVLALRDAIARLERDRPSGSCLSRWETEGERAGFSASGRSLPMPDVTGQDVTRQADVLPLGVPTLDHAMSGGLPLKGLSEIRVAETRDAGAATGFTLGLAALCQARRKARGELGPILWISETMAGQEAGEPYGVGLSLLGIDLRAALFSRPRNLQQALWIAEAALGFSVFSAVILEIRGNPARLGLAESRRLQLRSLGSGVPVFLLRQAGEEEASSAHLRLLVRPAPAAPFMLPDGTMLTTGIGHPAFHVIAEKTRAFSPVDAYLEWSSHARRFHPLDPVAVPLPANAADPVTVLSASVGRPGGAPALGRVMAFKRAS
ncbi:protein ImuA [Rhizobium sp. PP-F2F-G38]|nr:protein ImuA [Rhizobium sp. PP-WC-1G-195]PYE97100.1 protein ImuA [Rhizobium sp. PP-F2F-G38]